MPMPLKLLRGSLWLFLKTQPSGWRMNMLLGLLALSSEEWLHSQQDVDLLATIITATLRDHYAELPSS